MSSSSAMVNYKFENNTVYLQGNLNFESIVPLVSPLTKLIESSVVNAIDLQAVNYSNSAGVALLLEALRVAKKQQKTLVIQQVPDDMRQLMMLCGLEEIFSGAL